VSRSASDGLVTVENYGVYIKQKLGLDDKMKVSLYPIFRTYKPVPHGTYEIELSKDDILLIAKELNVPEWIFKGEKKGDEILVIDIIDLAIGKKILENPKIFKDIVDIVRSKSKELGDFIKERARSKLEEVS